MTALFRSRLLFLSALAIASVFPTLAAAQTSVPPATPLAPGPKPPVRAVATAPAEAGVRWTELTATQQSALTPLQRDWSGIDATSKQKWIELAGQFPKLAPDERARVQARMAEWARMTPTDRGRARLNFEEAKQVPAQDRQARWKAYQALDAEQKRQLAARAASAPEINRKAAQASARAERTGQEGPQAKSNIVPNPAFATPPKQVTPTVLQAQPGATTTFISRRPAPPPHQQTGMPKITGTPGFVDRTTLLPQRGPQGAAARPPSASGVEKAR